MYCNAPGPGGIDSYIYGGVGTSLTLMFSADGVSTYDGFLLEVTAVDKSHLFAVGRAGGDGGWEDGGERYPDK